jgi:large subunit ribosomal protein L6
MSRIGRKPVPIPSGVTVSVDGSNVKVKGPKGELARTFRPEMGIAVEEGNVVVTRPSDSKKDRAFHGLTRALLANMVQGVTEGYRRALEIVGVGYRAEKKGDALVLSVGYSHQVKYP